MSESLMPRALRFLASSRGATALAVVPLAAMLARPQKATATVLFSFTSASSGLSDPGPAPVSVTSSPLPNGGLHISGSIGPLSSVDYYGGLFISAYGGGYNLHLTGNLAGTLNAGDVISVATALGASVSGGTLNVGYQQFQTLSSGVNFVDAAPPALQAGSFQNTFISPPAPFGTFADNDVWTLDISLVWEGHSPPDILNLTLPSIDITSAPSPPGVWINPAGGSWALLENWSPGTTGGPGAAATFSNAIGSPALVTLDQTTTIGQITFNSANSYTLSPGVGNNVLILNNTGSPAAIIVAAGDHTIDTPMTLASPGLTISLPNAATTLSLNPNISGNAPFTLLNPGKIVFLPGSSAAKVSSLNLPGSSNNWTGTVDLTDNALILQTTTANKASIVSTLQNQIAFAKHGGLWDRPGITSSSVAANATDTSPSLALALADNADLHYATFRGQTLDNPATNGNTLDSLIIVQARNGDATLDNKVDSFDLTKLAAHWNSLAGNLWSAGDFNGDGAVNSFDLTLLAANWQFGVPGSLLAAQFQPSDFTLQTSSAVPEPTTLVLVLPALSLLKRRLRHGKSATTRCG